MDGGCRARASLRRVQRAPGKRTKSRVTIHAKTRTSAHLPIVRRAPGLHAAKRSRRRRPREPYLSSRLPSKTFQHVARFWSVSPDLGGVGDFSVFFRFARIRVPSVPSRADKIRFFVSIGDIDPETLRKFQSNGFSIFVSQRSTARVSKKCITVRPSPPFRLLSRRLR